MGTHRNICTYFNTNLVDPITNTTDTTTTTPNTTTTTTTTTDTPPPGTLEPPSALVYELLRLPRAAADPAKVGPMHLSRRPATSKRPSFETLESAFSKLRTVIDPFSKFFTAQIAKIRSTIKGTQKIACSADKDKHPPRIYALQQWLQRALIATLRRQLVAHEGVAAKLKALDADMLAQQQLQRQQYNTLLQNCCAAQTKYMAKVASSRSGDREGVMSKFSNRVRSVAMAGEMVRVQLTLLRLMDEVESLGTSWVIRASDAVREFTRTLSLGVQHEADIMAQMQSAAQMEMDRNLAHVRRMKTGRARKKPCTVLLSDLDKLKTVMNSCRALKRNMATLAAYRIEKLGDLKCATSLNFAPTLQAAMNKLLLTSREIARGRIKVKDEFVELCTLAEKTDIQLRKMLTDLIKGDHEEARQTYAPHDISYKMNCLNVNLMKRWTQIDAAVVEMLMASMSTTTDCMGKLAPVRDTREYFSSNKVDHILPWVFEPTARNSVRFTLQAVPTLSHGNEGNIYYINNVVQGCLLNGEKTLRMGTASEKTGFLRSRQVVLLLTNAPRLVVVCHETREVVHSIKCGRSLTVLCPNSNTLEIRDATLPSNLSFSTPPKHDLAIQWRLSINAALLAYTFKDYINPGLAELLL